MTENTENQKANNAIKINSIRNALKRTHDTQYQATLISPTGVIIKERDAIRKLFIRKETLSNYVQI